MEVDCFDFRGFFVILRFFGGVRVLCCEGSVACRLGSLLLGCPAFVFVELGVCVCVGGFVACEGLGGCFCGVMGV